MRGLRRELTRIIAELAIGAVGIVLIYLFMVKVFAPSMVHTLSNMGRVPHTSSPAASSPTPTGR